MVKHIVLWNFAEGLSEADKTQAGQKMKELLEPIRELVQVLANGLPSGNREVALISEFETVEALKTYQEHPAHVEAGKYVRSVTRDRACMDYEC